MGFCACMHEVKNEKKKNHKISAFFLTFEAVVFLRQEV